MPSSLNTYTVHLCLRRIRPLTLLIQCQVYSHIVRTFVDYSIYAIGQHGNIFFCRLRHNILSTVLCSLLLFRLVFSYVIKIILHVFNL